MGNYNVIMEKYIEQLQEMGKTIIHDTDNIEELQVKLKARGYITVIENSDRDYLKLVSIIV